MFLIYVILNAGIQGIFQEELMRYRITSVIGTIIPLFFFYAVFFHDFDDKYIKIITTCFFLGLLVFVTYYAYSFADVRFGDANSIGKVFDPATRVTGQRDSIFLSFGFLLAVLRNYHFNRAERIFGIWMIFCCLFVIIFSQTRLGYVLFLINFFCLFFVYKKYFFFIVTPIVLAGCLYFASYFASVGDVWALGTENNTNQFSYTVARATTMITSSVEFFSSGNIVDGSLTIRSQIWERILEYILSSPLNFLFGSGELGVHSLNFSFLVFDDSWSDGQMFQGVFSSESQYFDTLFRRGIIGIIFLFTIIFRVLFLSNYLRNFDKKNKDLYLVFLIGFIGLSFAFIFLPILRDRAFVIFFFIAYALLSSRAYIISNRIEP